MILQKIWSYLTFKKQPEFGDNNSTEAGKDSGKEGNNTYLRMMHGINRISIIMFLIGMIIVMFKIFK